MTSGGEAGSPETRSHGFAARRFRGASVYAELALVLGLFLGGYSCSFVRQGLGAAAAAAQWSTASAERAIREHMVA